MEVVCEECNSPLIFGEQFMVCSSCGLVTEISLPSENYWKLEIIEENRTDMDLTHIKRITPKGMRLFNRLTVVNKYTYRDNIEMRFRSFIHNSCGHFHLSVEIENHALYLFLKILRVYNIQTSDRIHIPILSTCLVVAVSAPEYHQQIPLKIFFQYLQSIGHRMNPRLFFNTLKKYPLLLNYYSPSNVETKIDFFRATMLSQFTQDPLLKIKFIQHTFPIEYVEYKKQLYGSFDLIQYAVKKRLNLRSRNPHRLCCGILYLANKITTRENNRTRFLNQSFFATNLNVSSTYVREGTNDVKHLLGGNNNWEKTLMIFNHQI